MFEFVLTWILIVSGVGLFLLLAFVLYALFQEYRSDRITALLYHRLLPEAESHLIADADRSYVISQELFAQQMEYLHENGYKTLSLDQLMGYLAGKEALPENPIVITFDDGFASNYHYAYPVLKKYRMKATIFMTPDRSSANFAKHVSVDAPLSDAQLCELEHDGIAIESHGMTHRYLTDLSTETVQWELGESKATLEGVLAKDVKYLAIPSGAYNRKIRRLAKQAGYRAVFCMLKGSNNRGSDRFALRRLVVGRDTSISEFAQLLQPSFAFRLRLTSSVQNFLALALGPAGLDRLRNVLYGSRFGQTVAQVHRYVIPGLAFVLVTVVAAGVVLFFRFFQ